MSHIETLEALLEDISGIIETTEELSMKDGDFRSIFDSATELYEAVEDLHHG